MALNLRQAVQGVQQLFRADAVPQPAQDEQVDPFDPQVMIGASVAYWLPAEGGWRLLEGEIIAASGTALVVKHARYGVKRTINPNWLESYLWKRETPLTEVTSAS